MLDLYPVSLELLFLLTLSFTHRWFWRLGILREDFWRYHAALRAPTWSLSSYIVNQLHLRAVPDWLAHLNSILSSFLSALNILELDRSCHLFGVPIDSDNVAKGAEEGVDFLNVKFLLWYILQIDGIATRINHISLLHSRFTTHLVGSTGPASVTCAHRILLPLIARVTIHRHVGTLVLHGQRVALVSMMILIMSTGTGVIAPSIMLLRHLPFHSLSSHLHPIVAVIVIPARVHITSMMMIRATAAHMASMRIVITTKVVVAHVTSSTRVPRATSLVMAAISLA